MLLPFASLLVSCILTSLYIVAILASAIPQCGMDVECLLREEWMVSRWRMLGMLLGSLLVLCIAVWLVWMAPRVEPNSIGTRELMGLHGSMGWWRDLGKPALGTVLLLLGPIAAQVFLFLQDFQLPFAKFSHWDWVKILLVGPVCEELVFRASLIPILDQWGGWSPASAVIISSLLFGVAHAYRLIFDRSQWLPILVQMGFTFVFGIYTGILFVWHRQFISCLLAHSLANAIGFPDWERVMALEPFRILIIGATLPVGIGLWIALYY